VNTQSPIVAGVFSQFPQARQAYLDLQAAGFTDEQIGVAQHNREEIDLRKSFQQLGMPQEQANAYDQQYRAGRIIVSVRPDGRDQEVSAILQRNGAISDQGSADEQVNDGYTGTTAEPVNGNIGNEVDPDTTRGRDVVSDQSSATSVRDDADVPEEQALRLREERLHVDKDRVQTGQVQIHKEIVTEQKTITVPVTHEEVVIERRQFAPDEVNQAGDVAPIGDEETIRIPVSEEQVQITKRPVVTNEVVVGKRQVQETQRVSDTVRHEEVRIDQQGQVPIHGLGRSETDGDVADGTDTTDAD
jgi:uncharacterized protein (TIGR02271 family)